MSYRAKKKFKAKKIDKFLDLTRKQTSLWNIKTMVMSIVVDKLGMINKGREKRREKKTRPFKPQHN